MTLMKLQPMQQTWDTLLLVRCLVIVTLVNKVVIISFYSWLLLCQRVIRVFPPPLWSLIWRYLWISEALGVGAGCCWWPGSALCNQTTPSIIIKHHIIQLLSRHICQTLLRGHGDKNALFALSSILRTRPPDWLGMAARLLILMAISAMVSPQPRPRVIGCLDYPFSR